MRLPAQLCSALLSFALLSLVTSISNLSGTDPMGSNCTVTVRLFVFLRGIGIDSEL